MNRTPMRLSPSHIGIILLAVACFFGAVVAVAATTYFGGH